MTRNFRDYGAFELKRSYQKNLSLGVIGAGIIHIILILSLPLIPSIFTEPDKEKTIRIRTIAQLMSPPPPPSLTELVTKMEQIAYGTFQPVLATQDGEDIVKKAYYGEIYGIVYDVSAQGLAAGSDSLGYIEIGIPSKHQLAKIELIETDRFPECIKSVLPRYPDSARKDGIEGVVWLQVLVDGNGKVIEVNVFRRSGVNVGFEEAAVDAAWQWEYRPALCNNKPVVVWIIYTLRFKLKSARYTGLSRQS